MGTLSGTLTHFPPSDINVPYTSVNVETGMAAKKRDTEHPEEERPDATTTPLLVEDGKFLSPAVKFTPGQLLRWFEELAKKHEKPRMENGAWACYLDIWDRRAKA